ncbi:unnamed protein product [Anisakis simplex]|uniref:NR LBD domain-containing protein n=1 Tax=Anisakis simplex TaxID=6269 RepID=A0A0M3JF02_ANISI|nr:unnamed protein product [Anisakis simplex]
MQLQILQEFSRVTIADIIRLTVPVVLNCAAVQLVEECKPVMSLINESLCETCEKVSRSSRLNQTEDYLDVMRELFIVESIIAKYNSLWSRFVAADENLVNSMNYSNRN